MKAPPSADAIIRGVADALPVGVWVARVPGGDFVYANETFQAIMGTAPLGDVSVGGYAEPYGIYDRDGALYPEERMPFVVAMRRGETVVLDDIVIHRRDGRRVFIRAQARPVFDADGTMTHVIVAFIDISREVQAEAVRVESERAVQAAQRLEALGQLAGGIGHDFNNLLASIKLLTGLLLDDERRPERREDLRRIADVTDRAAALTRSLLGLARRGKHLAGPVAMHELIRECCDLASRTHGSAVRVRLDLGALGDVVRGDRGQLDQVVTNLLTNALDAMPTGGDLSVTTRSEQADQATDGPGRSWLVLDVADTGGGIAPEIADRILEPYFTTKVGEHALGAGLGLATVHGVVTSHGGSLQLVETSRLGTTMRVRLPAAPEGRSAATLAQASAAPARRVALIVDDDAQLRSIAARVAQKYGFEVITAEDGAVAVDLFDQRGDEISVVLLDMVMPNLSGRETYLALRNRRPDLPVVLTTGHAHNDAVQDLLDLGVRTFLPKPYEIKALGAALLAALKAD